SRSISLYWNSCEFLTGFVGNCVLLGETGFEWDSKSSASDGPRLSREAGRSTYRKERSMFLSNVKWFRSQPSSVNRRFTSSLRVESLECRYVPAALTAVLSGGVLTITGTSKTEKISLFEDGGKVQVWWSNSGSTDLSNNKAFTGVSKVKI